MVEEDTARGPASQGQGAAADALSKSASVQSANDTSTATNEPTPPNNSNTGSYPSIDHDHIIKADFNKNGDPTGGHSLVNNDVRIIPGTAGQPNPQGVYEARVEMQNSSGGWQAKLSNGGWNTMFPKNWSEHQIKTEVEAAWNGSMKIISPNGKKWRSITPSGVVVEGYINPHTPNKTGRITAYPIY